MKKLLFLLPIILLAACDKKTSDAELHCLVSSGLEKNSEATLSEQDIDKTTDLFLNLKTFDDYAVVTVNGESINFVKKSEERFSGIFGDVYITYKGILPGTNRNATISIFADISNRVIKQYDLSFDDENFISEKTGDVMSIGYSCYPVNEEYVDESHSVNVPFDHNYKMPNATEKCINEINEKVLCANDECNELLIHIPSKGSFILTQEEAFSVSPYWDYSDMKFYSNDGIMYDYEKDACDVLKRLNEFIKDMRLDK